jgi:acyl-CoA reductase-like NAD-dependent aldehyde dehydrogenase
MATAPAMTQDALVLRNPATGEDVGRIPTTPPEDVARAAEKARAAQAAWRETTWRQRRDLLARWHATLSRGADRWADAICEEVGKPRGEALGEVISTLDALKWTVRHAGRWLREERIGPGRQRWLLLPKGRMRWVPYGLVGMIGTWNYPLFLNAPPIGQALAAGNAVVWKPSELASRIGHLLQESLEDAGIPPGLVATVFGRSEVGQALIDAGPDKGMFTGGVENGRRILGEFGRRGIPALAELSGFDPAIVLPDAPREATLRALTWGAFVGCGQTCVSVKRVYLMGEAAPWAEALAERARALRVGDPRNDETDLGPMISEASRDRFHATIRAAVSAGARLLAGGTIPPGPGWFYPPTVLLADSPWPESALAGAFGPVVVLRGVADAEAAVSAANAGSYGLSASVWGRDLAVAKGLARRLGAGSVSVNDAVFPTAHASAPFGGIKASGYGRTHGPIGLREFAQPQVLFARRSGGLRPHLFPYSGRVARVLTVYRRWFH